jgi:WXG100 family type VII secretion target
MDTPRRHVEDMVARITVTPEEMRTVATQVMTGATEIEVHLKQLLSRVQQLGETWEGTAAMALQSLYERWNKEAASLNGTLTEISRSLEQAAANYESAEQAIAKSFQP